MNWLIDNERRRLELLISNAQFSAPMYCGIRFYSDKLVLERKKNSNKTIRDILIELAEEDAKGV